MPCGEAKNVASALRARCYRRLEKTQAAISVVVVVVVVAAAAAAAAAVVVMVTVVVMVHADQKQSIHIYMYIYIHLKENPSLRPGVEDLHIHILSAVSVLVVVAEEISVLECM